MSEEVSLPGLTVELFAIAMEARRENQRLRDQLSQREAELVATRRALAEVREKQTPLPDKAELTELWVEEWREQIQPDLERRCEQAAMRLVAQRIVRALEGKEDPHCAHLLAALKRLANVR
ncbi:hypothetical protein [Magnetofaba australis]|uniref:Uncharacterized protein n=1 Tax=Magnetofaba australis IT-1 TaxID=1434232 RepID=A0A1Y2JZV5_9PROT|nr:hypothetical protein [Magnetofaba australis]OSM00448.1 hypothetical protein MAIT1_00969 [Magnetofaba australis IT-1]